MDKKQGWGIIFMGVVWLFVTITFTVLMNYTASKCDKETTGTVIRVIERQTTKRDSKSRRSYTETTYSPVVSFVVDGVEYTAESNESSSSYRNSEGRTLNVLYNSDDPNIACVKPSLTWKIFSWVFIGIGIYLVVQGIKILIFGVRRR